jgi:capsular polysaccharide export protein
MEGLTFQGSLDDFWKQASPPDKALFDNFQQAVIEQTQINGAFYNQKGIEMSVLGSLPKLLDTLS